jgi:sec-independent protein translocase protein TatA
MGMPSMPELLVILAIVVLLFGAKKIPDLAKGVGKGIKDFKKAIKDDETVADAQDEVKELKADAKPTTVTPTTTTTTQTTENTAPKA